MQCQEIKNKEEWDAFLAEVKPNTFLHTWQWKEVQELSGEQCTPLGFFATSELIAIALVITVNAKRGVHYLIPHGPILKDVKYLQGVIRELTTYNIQHATNKNAVALRIAPLVENTDENNRIFSSLGFRPSPMHVHAECTWILNIAKPDDMLLHQMRKTTRNAIAKAQHEGVTVEIIKDTKAIERFWPLYEQTKTRHDFIPFQKSFLQSQAEIFGRNNAMFFTIATYQDRDVAAAMLIQSYNTVFYYHGASVKIPVPATQLLQWEAIQEAKRRGATRYNFWGIGPENDPRHPFAGITVFKKGFGGYEINYMHAQDLPLSWKYWMLWAIEMWRKKKRGF